MIGGLYLVLDPSIGLSKCRFIAEEAIHGGVDIIQVWNNFGQSDSISFLNGLKEVTSNVELIINERWELLSEVDLDGVHFDQIPADFPSIKQEIGGKILGLTICNDVDSAEWAEKNGFDYLSFCSVFPSPSVDFCAIVDRKSIDEVRRRTSLPLFGSGGINRSNAGKVMRMGLDGIAVISEIMNAEDPKLAARELKLEMK